MSKDTYTCSFSGETFEPDDSFILINNFCNSEKPPYMAQFHNEEGAKKYLIGKFGPKLFEKCKNELLDWITVAADKDLNDYLEEKGFEYSAYGTVIYWHHSKCPDILQLDNGIIFIYSLPDEIDIDKLYLPVNKAGHKYISDRKHVDILNKALEGCNS